MEDKREQYENKHFRDAWKFKRASLFDILVLKEKSAKFIQSLLNLEIMIRH